MVAGPGRRRTPAAGSRLRVRRGRGRAADRGRGLGRRTGSAGTQPSGRPATGTPAGLGGVRRPAGRGAGRRVRASPAHRAAGPAGRRAGRPRLGGAGAVLRLRGGRDGAGRCRPDRGARGGPGPGRGGLRPANLATGSVYLGDLFDPLPDSLRGRVRPGSADALYVPSEAIRLMPPEAREHEPRLALDGGPDGLDIQRRIISQAPDWLAGGGRPADRDQRPTGGRHGTRDGRGRPAGPGGRGSRVGSHRGARPPAGPGSMAPGGRLFRPAPDRYGGRTRPSIAGPQARNRRSESACEGPPTGGAMTNSAARDSTRWKGLAGSSSTAST